MSQPRISVLIVDDQHLIREALRAFLDGEPSIDVVGSAADGLEAISAAKRLVPDVVLMDVRMPGMAGPEATTQIKRSAALRATRVLVLTSFEDADAVQSCLQAGADGFIGKGVAPDQLIAAIHAVHRGESPLSPRAARSVINEFGSPSRSQRQPNTDLRVSTLTAREIEVVSLAAQGLGNYAIASRLSIAPTTAKTHVANAMKKLHVHDRAHLVALAYRLGLVHQ